MKAYIKGTERLSIDAILYSVSLYEQVDINPCNFRYKWLVHGVET